MWIVGLGLIVTSSGLIWGYWAQKKRVAALTSTDTASVELVQAVAQDVGADSLSYRTGLQGTIVCPQPLVSELAAVECIYYTMKVIRKYEETRWVEDEKGNRTRQTQSGSTTEASNARSIPFWIQDRTGQIQVRPEGAEFITEQVLSRFVPAEQSQGSMSITIGGYTLSLKGGSSGSRHTTGYQFQEEAIPIGRNVFVLGEIVSSDGELIMKRPNEGRFVVSLKSAGELVRGGKRMMTILQVSSILSGLAGVVVVIVALLS